MELTVRDIEKASKLLFPTGRAWNYVTGIPQSEKESTVYIDGQGNVFVDGQGNQFTGGGEDTFIIPTDGTYNGRLLSIISIARKVLSIQDQRIPDNENFTSDDAENWERVFGIIPPAGSTLEDRKKVILSYWSIPSYENRLTKDYLQEQLNIAGYDVQVVENRFYDPLSNTFKVLADNDSEFDSNTFDSFVFDGTGYDPTEILMNYIDPAKEDPINLNEFNANNVIFIGHPTEPRANIDISKKSQFRELILKYKPAHMACMIFVNYV